MIEASIRSFQDADSSGLASLLLRAIEVHEN